jgi:hypothetical protein
MAGRRKYSQLFFSDVGVPFHLEAITSPRKYRCWCLPPADKFSPAASNLEKHQIVLTCIVSAY